MKQKNLFFTLSIVLSFAFYFSDAQNVEASWESLQKRGYPQWFSDAKLGIFVHYGLYSVPSYSGKEQYAEWFYRGLMTNDKNRVDFQKRVFGEDFQYEDYDKLFKAELFNADEWAQLFADAGAKYVLLVTKHHDGYCLWDSKYKPDFNSVNGGPKRNIVAELTESVRKKGLKMGFYYSLPEWRNELHRWYVDSPDSIAPYVEKYMIPQFKELVSTYKPSVLFADGEWLNTAEQWHAAELISWYYNEVGEEAIVNDRWGHGANYGYRTPEYSAGITVTDRPWAECRGLGRSFALNRNEPISNYVTSEELICHFVKLVAAGGGMTLNVGPAADGQIPLFQQERLLDLGEWLKLNGEAIYGSKPFSKFYEEKDFSMTRVDSNINFVWVRNAPDKALTYDNFEVEWSGFLTAPETGKYTFTARVDDYLYLQIGDNVLLNNFEGEIRQGQHGSENTLTYSAEMKLKAGEKYPVKIRFKEVDLEARAQLFWSCNGAEKEIIPAQAFGDGLNATYSCRKPFVAYTTQENKLYAIALEFPDDQLVLEIPEPAKEAKIYLLGRTEPLPWMYKNGKLYINTSMIKYSEVKSIGAWTFSIDWN